MSGLFAQLVEDFKRGRDRAYAERGYRQDRRDAAPADTDPAETQTDGDAIDDTSLITELSDTIKALQTRAENAEADRDAKQKALADLVAEVEPRRARTEKLEQRIAELEGDAATNKTLIDDMASQLEALQARTDALEGERDTLAAPLKIPGMKRVLSKVVHEDSHKQKGPLTEDQRRQLTEWSQAVNAAFALIKRLTAKPDEAGA